MSTTRTVEEHYGDLQIEHDERSQRREWLARNVAIALMGLYTLVALTGLLGHGPLSHAVANAPDGGLQVDYERAMQFDTYTPLRVVMRPRGSRATLVVRGLTEHFEIQQIEPSPSQMIAPDRHETRFVFETETSGPSVIHLILRPQNVGLMRTEFALDAGAAVPVNIMVLP